MTFEDFKGEPGYNWHITEKWYAKMEHKPKTGWKPALPRKTYIVESQDCNLLYRLPHSKYMQLMQDIADEKDTPLDDYGVLIGQIAFTMNGASPDWAAIVLEGLKKQ